MRVLEGGGVCGDGVDAGGGGGRRRDGRDWGREGADGRAGCDGEIVEAGWKLMEIDE